MPKVNAPTLSRKPRQIGSALTANEINEAFRLAISANNFLIRFTSQFDDHEGFERAQMRDEAITQQVFDFHFHIVRQITQTQLEAVKEALGEVLKAIEQDLPSVQKFRAQFKPGNGLVADAFNHFPLKRFGGLVDALQSTRRHLAPQVPRSL